MSSPKWVLATLLVIATTSIALIGRIAFDWFIGPAPAFLIPFFLPVVVTALYYGVRWGSIATVVNTAIVTYFFTPPVTSSAILAFEDQVRVGSFVVLGGVLAVLTGNLRRYRNLAEEDERILARRQNELELEVAGRREAERRLELRLNERTAEIEAQKRLLDAVLDCLPISLIIADPTGKFIRINRATYEVCGAVPKAAGVEDYPAWVGYWPKNGLRVEPMEWPLSRAVFASESCTEEIEIERFGDHVRRTLQISAVPIRGSDGTIIAGVVTSVDMTKQKQAADTLRESEQKFRAVFHSQFQFIGLMSLDGLLLDANRTALAVAGVLEDEVLGKPFWETAWWTHDPVQQQRLKEAVCRAAAGEPDRFEASHLRADGTVMWVDFSLTPYSQNGTVVLLIPEGRDITGRKQAEAELLLSEARFKTLAGDAPVGIFETDANGHCFFVNSRWCALAGMTRDAAMGQGWVAALHPDDRERVFREWSTATEKRCEFFSEYRFRTPSGRDNWLSGNAVALRDATGGVVGFIGTVTDITARKRSSELITALVESSSDAHLIFNRTGIIECNQAAVSMLRMTGKEELLLKHPAEFSPQFQPDGRISKEKSIEMDALAREKGFHRFDWIHTRADGEDFPCEATLTPIQLESGDALLVVWHEISERVNFQAQLQAANRQLTVINEELTQFAYIASHDLKAPLRGINSLADFVFADCKDKLPAESMKHLQMIKDRIFRMQRLLEDLLEYSQAGQDDSGTRTMSSLAVVQAAIDLCDPPAAINIELTGDDTKLETWITPLETCLRNLIGNSIKHRAHPTGRIRIASEQSGDFITFSVSDDGCGIPVQHHERIFRMFEVLRRRDEVEGSGMGLAVVKKTVEAFGGSITVESPNSWSGSTFHLRWPNASRTST
jgi:PAS domain S-box-containing protein